MERMSYLHAIVLGLVQGLTAFFPISASGHRIIVPRLLGWAEQPLSFDAALHLGTALALLLYFGSDVITLTRDGLADILLHRGQVSAYRPTGRLALVIALGCVPAVVAGALLHPWIADHVRSAGLAAAALLTAGLVMLAAERWGRGARGLDSVDIRRSLVVGAAQAAALIPGVSRSGITIGVGMFTGLTREAAVRFSCLLAAPVIVAAGLKELPDLRHHARDGVGVGHLFVGLLVALATGLLTLHLLLRYVARRPLSIFVWYQFIFAAITLAALGFS